MHDHVRRPLGGFVVVRYL